MSHGYQRATPGYPGYAHDTIGLYAPTPVHAMGLFSSAADFAAQARDLENNPDPGLIDYAMAGLPVAAAAAGPLWWMMNQPAKIAARTRALNKQIGATGWHGSPHEWEKPDIKPILEKTGEGFDMAGTGLYSGRERPTGETYARNLARLPEAEVTFAGRTYEPGKNLGKDWVANGLRRLIYGDQNRQVLMNPQLAKRFLRDKINETYNLQEVAAHAKFADNPKGLHFELQRLQGELKSKLNLIDQADIGEPGPYTGYLYELDIPNRDITRYLHLDKPFREQNKSIREGLLNSGIEAGPRAWARAARKEVDSVVDAVRRNGLRGPLDEANPVDRLLIARAQLVDAAPGFWDDYIDDAADAATRVLRDTGLDLEMPGLMRAMEELTMRDKYPIPPSLDGWGIQGLLGGTRGHPEARERLLSMGILGNRYIPAHQTARGQSHGLNYVTFDPDRVKVKNRTKLEFDR
jgi:hypothetical protein